MLRPYQTGPGHTGPVCFSYIGAMTPAILLALLVQAPQASAPRPFAYRGFAPGMSYRDFTTRARSIAQGDSDILACQTMRRTAQVMDCGVRVRDPVDSARFYLSANVIEGRTSVIAFVDSGNVPLVRRTQDQMRRQLGAPHRRERSMWEWTKGRRFIRLNWRGGRDWRVISITVNDRDVVGRMSGDRPEPKPQQRRRRGPPRGARSRPLLLSGPFSVAANPP